ncbi:hypothetical protein M9Y10_022689 [Tritrichomonas musculus]|uniref:Uncharacterized protein n=1 Tax=Tritrichomonas musculus TaxID=1915356 RepID=A0ABR2KSZ8_9EUKA
MSRQIKTSNFQTKSKTYDLIDDSNSDSSLDLTELQAQNSQLQMDNINKTAALSQISKENNEIKKKYEELLNALSNHPNNSSNTYSSPNPTTNTANSTNFFENMTQSFLPNDKAESEVQLWTEMWTHIVSMVTSIIPYSNVSPKSGNERRAILIDLVSKLCQRVNDPSNDKYNKLKKKYQKMQEEIIVFRQKESEMNSEINKYKLLLGQKESLEAENDEAVLAQKIKTLEGLIHKLIAKQKYLQESHIDFSIKPTTSTTFLSSKQDLMSHHKQKKEQPKIQHRVIQLDDDSDKASSSSNNEEYNSDESHIPISSKLNNCNKDRNSKGSIHSFTKTRQSTSQGKNNYNKKNSLNHSKNSLNHLSNCNIKKSNNDKKVEQSILKKFGIDEISEISTNVINNEKVSKKSKKKSFEINNKIEFDSSYSSRSIDSSDFQNNSDDKYHRQLLSAEAEADEILAESYNRRKKKNIIENNYEIEDIQKPNRKIHHKNNSKKKNRNKSNEGKQLRESYGNHLNQLVSLTNHLTDDYHRLGKYLGNESYVTDLSIDHLSKLHDSLLSVEKKLDDISE